MTTTTIDLSIDELLLLEENQYQTSNVVFANIKPIGVCWIIKELKYD